MIQELKTKLISSAWLDWRETQLRSYKSVVEFGGIISWLTFKAVNRGIRMKFLAIFLLIAAGGQVRKQELKSMKPFNRYSSARSTRNARNSWSTFSNCSTLLIHSTTTSPRTLPKPGSNSANYWPAWTMKESLKSLQVGFCLISSATYL